MFRKLEIEISIIFLIILGIIAFFIVGKVLEVKSLSQESEVNSAIIESLEGIEKQLSAQNCISIAEDQEAKVLCMQ